MLIFILCFSLKDVQANNNNITKEVVQDTIFFGGKSSPTFSLVGATIKVENKKGEIEYHKVTKEMTSEINLASHPVGILEENIKVDSFGVSYVTLKLEVPIYYQEETLYFETSIDTINYCIIDDHKLITLNNKAYDKEVTLPSNIYNQSEELIQSIGTNAIKDTKISELIVPNSYLTLETGSFSTNSNLKKITLSDNIEIIEKDTFIDNPLLKEITIGSKLNNISKNSFKNCPSILFFYVDALNQTYYSPIEGDYKGVLFLKSTLEQDINYSNSYLWPQAKKLSYCVFIIGSHEYRQCGYLNEVIKIPRLIVEGCIVSTFYLTNDYLDKADVLYYQVETTYLYGLMIEGEYKVEYPDLEELNEEDNQQLIENPNPTSYNEENEIVYLQDLVREGYVFLGYFDQEGNKITYIDCSLKQDLVISVQWRKIYYTISYEFPDDVILLEQSSIFDEYNLASPLKITDYEFMYYIDLNTNERIDLLPNPIEEDFYLRAIYRYTKFTITYILEDLENNEENVYSYNVSEKIIKLYPIIKPEYEFLYFLDEEGEQLLNIDPNSAKNYILTPVFKKIVYKITILNEYTESLTELTYNIYENQYILPEVKMIGYKYLGYEYDDDVILEIDPSLEKDYYLILKMELLEYNVEYTLKTKRTIFNYNSTYTILDQVNLSGMDIQGYNIQSWYKDSNLNYPFEGIDYLYPQDLYLYAKLEAIVYRVKCVDTFVQEIKVEFDDYFTLRTPGLSYYTCFKGWNYEDRLFTNKDGISLSYYSFTNDITLTGNIEKTNYVLTKINYNDTQTFRNNTYRFLANEPYDLSYHYLDGNKLIIVGWSSTQNEDVALSTQGCTILLQSNKLGVLNANISLYVRPMMYHLTIEMKDTVISYLDYSGTNYYSATQGSSSSQFINSVSINYEQGKDFSFEPYLTNIISQDLLIIEIDQVKNISPYTTYYLSDSLDGVKVVGELTSLYSIMYSALREDEEMARYQSENSSNEYHEGEEEDLGYYDPGYNNVYIPLADDLIKNYEYLKYYFAVLIYGFEIQLTQEFEQVNLYLLEYVY